MTEHQANLAVITNYVYWASIMGWLVAIFIRLGSILNELKKAAKTEKANG